MKSMTPSKDTMTPDEIFEEIKKIESLGRYTIVLSSDQCQIWDKKKHNAGRATGLIIDADFHSTFLENASDCFKGCYDYLVNEYEKPKTGPKTFRELLKEQLVDEDGDLSIENLNIDNWPKTNTEDSPDEYEPICLENWDIYELSESRMKLFGGGDWQNPVMMVVELVDGKLTCTSSEILLEKPDGELREVEVLLLLSNCI